MIPTASIHATLHNQLNEIKQNAEVSDFTSRQRGSKEINERQAVPQYNWICNVSCYFVFNPLLPLLLKKAKLYGITSQKTELPYGLSFIHTNSCTFSYKYVLVF